MPGLIAMEQVRSGNRPRSTSITSRTLVAPMYGPK